MELHTWLTFAAAGVLISVSPGAGAVACMATGMRHGLRLGWWNIAGMQMGIALQLVIVGAGVGALLATSTFAFNTVKWLGAAYLVYLGWKQFTASVVPLQITAGGDATKVATEVATTVATEAAANPASAPARASAVAPAGDQAGQPPDLGSETALRRQLFWQGFLVNGTNPKATVFLLAVMPQFIDPAKPLLMQYAICAVTLTLIDLPVMGTYTYFAARVLTQMREPRQIKWMNRMFGGMFMAAGGFLAAFKRTA